jgi:lysophospholipid acyltransferase (LPLAT)-like uncharacterized protein
MKTLLHFILLRLSWFFVKGLVATYKIEHDENNQKVRQEVNGPFVFAIWHEHGMSFVFGHAYSEPKLVLASRSKDGDFAAFISQKLGMIPVRGSSRKKGVNKGGQEAIETYVREIRRGISGGITVDGPKGPCHVCKPGVVKIAQQTGRPIVPGVALASAYWELNSWDRFKIPKPFSTIRLSYGQPIWVKPELSAEELSGVCQVVGESLTELLTQGS